MTELEWMACDEAHRILAFVRGKASDRKLRLFAVGCCRRIWHLMMDERSRGAVEVAERFADGEASQDEVFGNENVLNGTDMSTFSGSEFFSCNAAYNLVGLEELNYHTNEVRTNAAAAVASAGFAPDLRQEWLEASRIEGVHQSDLLRCILGNPFRPITLDPAWLSSTAKQLAAAIYNDRAFDRLPILADALEDAGCTNQDILNHCRQSGEHCRGCWVVDLLLGKT